MANKRTTKENILNILKKTEEISIKQLMTYFTISEVAVRRHLNDLLRQKLIAEKTVKQEIGRPIHMYSLTGKGHNTFPNQYADLPVELLQDLEVSLGKEAVQILLRQRKKREGNDILVTLENKNFDEKIITMLAYLNEQGYMFEYEKNAAGDFEIKNYNCPIYNLASVYTEMCTNEKEMYEELFPKSNITSKSCMGYGENHCCWYISQPKKDE